MSFSGEVKEELMNRYVKARHCQKALLLALQTFDPKNVEQDADGSHTIYNFTSQKKTFTIILQKNDNPKSVTEKNCCKRAFLRGAFLAAGSVSDPEKEYRFDIACASLKDAEFLKELFVQFAIHPHITKRREKHVLYIKEGEQIADALNVLEAHKAMMQFENARILREMRGSVNRKVNCETANINKAVAASLKQMEDIRFIAETVGLETLDEKLKAAADARLSNPDETLEELGKRMVPPLSKSAVNHRMRKLSQIAEELRSKQRESV